MRALATIPHPYCRITILSWNDKFFIELEASQYKQVYKIPADSINGLDGVKALVSKEFIERNMKRFKEMSEDFSRTFEEYNNKDK